MNGREVMFDHEKLDVYQFAIRYVAFSFEIASKLPYKNRMTCDQWLRAAQSIPLNIAEGNGKTSLKDKSRFLEIARGSALECAAIHDVLLACGGICTEDNIKGKEALRSIVNMLTKLIQRSVVKETNESYAVFNADLILHPTPTPTPTRASI